MNEPYQFKEEDAVGFANYMNCRTRRKGSELEFNYCPFCHGGAKKDKATFSINLKTGQCECKRSSCSYKGNMITLARDTGYELSSEIVRRYNINNYNGKFRKFKEMHRESTDRAVEYMKSRGIGETITKRYELTTKEDSSIMVFPFKDENGELKFIKYRNLDYKKGVTDGAKEWCEHDCMPILFGMNQCNANNKTLIITEGQIDSLSIAEAGFENAVSVPTGKNGFTWVGHCWEWVNSFEKIIVFGDKEGTTITLLEELRKKFHSMQVFNVRLADYRDCKDANEILQKYGPQQIRTCIENAEQPPIKRVIKLSTVQRVDFNAMEKLRTGIEKLDHLLHGGIPFGGVALISGKSGEGKSTLASQILTHAIHQGYRCFAYSGELPNYAFKAWIDFQIAGTAVKTYQTSDAWHDSKHYIADDHAAMIEAWYEDYCFMYDNSLFEDENDETVELPKMIEDVIHRDDVRVILIDNLMTALDMANVNGYDKYDNQSLLIKRLTRIALRNNVLILLVAHKKKNSDGFNENDDISGSSDIANLATMNISYGKCKKNDPVHYIKVTKNRWFGDVELEGWATEYDPASRRIYITPEERDFNFKWYTENLSEGFSDVVPEDIPF